VSSVVIIVVMRSNNASLSSECEVKTNLLMAAVAAFLLILQKLPAVHDAAALTDRLLTLMETRRANKEW